MVRIMNNSDAVFVAVREKAEWALKVAARKVAASARQIVPVDTGSLKSTIEVKQEGLTAHIGSDIHYAAYVEAGTSKMSAQPYLRPALMANLMVIKKAFKAV